MIHRAISLLILLAVGVQTLPVRVCAVAEAMTGTSCHDRDFPTNAASNSTFEGHAPGAGGANHDPACQCEKPKGELDRGAAQLHAIHLAPVAARPIELCSNLIPGPSLPAAEQPPPDRASAGVTLPLLN